MPNNSYLSRKLGGKRRNYGLEELFSLHLLHLSKIFNGQNVILWWFKTRPKSADGIAD